MTGTRRMSEADWRECICPELMLAYLGERASARKKCLFACACVRRVWPLLTDQRLRQAVELVEYSADKPMDARQLKKVRQMVRSLRGQLEGAAQAAAVAVEALVARNGPILERPRDIREPSDVISAMRQARALARAAEAEREERSGVPATLAEPAPIRPLEALDAVELLREVFGNPFRPLVLDPAWLAWNEGTVARTARVLYKERRFRDLPILADALEEAGCTDTDILDHCRAPREHVRGCWVVDALLGMA